MLIWENGGRSKGVNDQHLRNKFSRSDGVDFGNFHRSCRFSSDDKNSLFEILPNGSSPLVSTSQTKHAKE